MSGRLYGVKALKEWCRRSLSSYPGVKMTNMSSDWRDGRAFCALIHRYRPDLLDYRNMEKKDLRRNCQLAFDIAEQELNVPAILDVNDIVEYENPDPLSILTYVSQLYHSLSPIITQGNKKKMGAVHSLIYCKEVGVPVERDNPFREEMLQWEEEKKTQIMKEKICSKDSKTMKRKLYPDGSVLHEVSRLKLSAKMVSNQKPLQSKSNASITCPKPYQPVKVRDTTSLLSQTSKYLQSVRKERNSNPLNSKKFNFLSPSSRLSENVKQNMQVSPPSSNIEKPKETQSTIQKASKHSSRNITINLSFGITKNIFESKLTENQTIMKFSLPFF